MSLPGSAAIEKKGNIGSGLIDLLLWRYLDCDEKFLDGPVDE